MARTTFSGPVKSDNGFEGDIIGSVSGTVVNAATVTATGTLVVGNATITSGSAVSGVIGSTQLGYLPVSIGGVTKYIALYSSLTL
jgi:hypothetical protein